MGKSRKKSAKQRHDPSLEKKPKQHEKPSFEGQPFCWTFEQADMDGCFGWGVCGLEKIFALIGKLQKFERTSWSTVIDGGSHDVEYDQFSKPAIKRLQDLNQDDTESLFSLRISGRERIWGHREYAQLYILWWDPEHQVCPSVKKHT